MWGFRHHPMEKYGNVGIIFGNILKIDEIVVLMKCCVILY